MDEHRGSRRSSIIVDRQHERARLLEALAERRNVLLTGDVGVGKSRLLSWVGAQVVGAGHRLERVYAAPSLTEMPGGALSHLLPPLRGDLAPSQIVYDVIAYFRNEIGADDATFLVDDTPWLDSLSAVVIAQMMRLGFANVFATARTGEPLPDAIADVLAADQLELLPVSDLDRLDTVRLAEALSGMSLPPRFADWLWRTASGNPLFVTELVTSALDRFGPDELEAAVNQPLESSVADLLNGRLARLPFTERSQLEMLAVAGSLSVSALNEFGDPGALARLEDRHLITIMRDGRRANVRLGHPLIGEALQSTMNFTRRRQFLLRVADHIEGCGMRRSGDALRVALAREAAGANVSVDIAALAAQVAFGRGAMPEAAEFGRVAFAEAPSINLGVLIASSFAFQGRPVEADAMLDSLEPLIETDEERSLLASTQAVNAIHGLLDLRHASAVLDHHEPRTGGSWRYELTGPRIGVNLYRGQIGMAVETFDRAVADDQLPARARVSILISGIIPLYLAGRTDHAVAHAEALLHLFASLSGGLMTVRLQAELELAEALAWSGELVDAVHIVQRLRAEVTATGDHASLTIVVIVAGLIDALRGEHAAAARSVVALGSLEGSVYRPWIPYLHARMAAVALRRRERTVGVTYLDVVARSTPTGYDLHGLARERSRAELAVLDRDPAGATSILVDARGEAMRRGNVLEGVLAAVRLVALSRDTSHVQTCADISSQLVGSVGSSINDCMRALDVGSTEAAGEAVQRLSVGGYAMLADDLADAIALRDVSPSGRAVVRSLRAQTAELFDRRALEVPAPTIVGAHSTRLTARERQVARLVVGGAADADVASTLGLSVRTVHAHVRSIFMKLGISRRTELADHITAPVPEG